MSDSTFQLNIVTANPTLGTCNFRWVGVDSIQASKAHVL